MRRFLLVAWTMTACAPAPLRHARHMGLSRVGVHSATELHLVGLDVVTHAQPPRVGAAADPIVWEQTPELDTARLASTSADVLARSAPSVGLSMTTEDVTLWSGELPYDLPRRLAPFVGRESAGAVLLRVHVGLCDVDGHPVPCVRSPDTALGYGPPAVEGIVFSRMKAASDGAYAKRVTLVDKAFAYTIDRDSGAHWDRPFIGVGDSAQERAEDAIEQALTAWLTVYAGRRGQRL